MSIFGNKKTSSRLILPKTYKAPASSEDAPPVKQEWIYGYRLLGELKTAHSGFSKWGFAEKDGNTWFIKEMINPVWPTGGVLSEELKNRKIELCRKFEEEHKLLYAEINRASDGNLVHIQEFFRFGAHYYLVMERVTAQSWEIVASLAMEDRIRICKSLIHTVGGLHAAGIIHGDLKPDNIMFKRLSSGKLAPKIIDFDSSYFQHTPPEHTDEIEGDPVYLAPETFFVIENEEGSVTTAADVYALGLIMHQVLTGSLPSYDTGKYNYPFEALLAGEHLLCSKEPRADSSFSHGGEQVPELWQAMINAMLLAVPEKRISLNQAYWMWRYGEDGPGSGPKKDSRAFAERKKPDQYFRPAGDLL